MKLTRGKRIALELLGPPALGATLITLVIGVGVLAEGIATGRFTRDLRSAGVIVLLVYFFAYVLAGLQSIAYTAIMEWRFARGLDPRSWRAVGWSTGLGFLAGAAIVAAFAFERGLPLSETLAVFLYFGGIGLVVGFGLGLLVKGLSPKPSEATAGSP